MNSSKKLLEYSPLLLSKIILLPVFVLGSLLVSAAQVRAERPERPREFVVDENGEKKYCFGFDNSVDFYWPGKGGGTDGLMMD